MSLCRATSTALLVIISLTGCATKLPVTPSPDITTKHRVKVPWKLPPAPFTGFYIYKSIDNVNFIQLVVITGPQTSYVDSNVKPNVTYYYKAKTYCTTCSPSTSVFSNTVQVTVKP